MLNQYIHIFLLLCLGLVAQAQENPFQTFLNAECQLGLEAEKHTEILPAQYKKITVTPVGNTWLIEAKSMQGTQYFLYKDHQKIKLPYATVSKLNDQLLRVGQALEYGIINTEGQGIALMQYQNILPAGPQAAMVQQNDRYGLLAPTGKQLIPTNMQAIKVWADAFYWAQQEDGTWQLYDEKGTVVIGAHYSNIHFEANNPTYCAVQKEGKWGLIDTKNTLHLPLEHNKIEFTPTLIATQDKKGKWSFRNRSLQPINKQKYEVFAATSTAAVIVTQKGKQGLLADNGTLVLPIKYPLIKDLHQQHFAIQQATEEWRLYNYQDKKWQATKFSAIRRSATSAAGFWVQQDKKWGFMGYNDQWLLKPTFVTIQVLPHHPYTIVSNEDKQKGVVNNQGQAIIPTEYAILTPFRQFFKVKQQGTAGWFYINKQNQKLNCSFLK